MTVFRAFRVSFAGLLALVLWSVPALAQLGVVSNLSIRGGITIGSTEVGEPGVTNGTLRWNAATTNHQFYNGTSWVDIGTGDVATEGAPLEYAYLMLGTNGLYTFQYGPRATTNYTDWITSVANTNLTATYPGQLLRVTSLGKVYECIQTIVHSNYVPFTGVAVPYPTTHASFWKLFSEDGTDGAPGTKGDKGDTGLGNVVYGIWSSSQTYTQDPSVAIVVRYDGQWYDYIKTNATTNATSVAETPSLYTNSWEVSVEKGTAATVLYLTNLTWRESFDAGIVYNTNDFVRYSFNLFVVGETNVAASGHTPLLDANGVGMNSPYWDVLLGRGSKGNTGATGADGAVTYVTNLFNIYGIFATNMVATNAASASERLLVWSELDGGTNKMHWSGATPVSSNDLIDVAGELFYVVNGVTNRVGTGTTDASGVSVALIPTSVVFAAQDVESALVGIDSAIGSVDAITLQSYTAQQVADLDRSTADFDYHVLTWSPTTIVSRANGSRQYLTTAGPSWIRVPAGDTNIGYVIALDIPGTTNEITFIPDGQIISTNSIYTYTNATMTFIFYNAWNDPDTMIYSLPKE